MYMRIRRPGPGSTGPQKTTIRQRPLAPAPAHPLTVPPARPPMAPGPAPVIQRQVVEEDDEEGTYFTSDLAPDSPKFRKRSEAENLDKVITEYQRLTVVAQKKAAEIGKHDLARLQRIKGTDFHSWVPEHCRKVGTVQALHQKLFSHLAQKRNAMSLSEPFWTLGNEKFEEMAEILKKEGFQEAEDLLAQTKRSNRAQASGYKYQLQQNVRELQQGKLMAIEPEYGKPKKSTKRRPRADSKTVEGFTQPTQENFYPVEEEKKEVVLTDYKLGYKDEKEYDSSFLKEFDQYGGTALDSNEVYGGIENTQSTPPRFDYKWYDDKPPEWVTKKLPQKALTTRKDNSNAFPGGLRLGKQQILSPLKKKEKTKTPLKPTSGEDVFKKPDPVRFERSSKQDLSSKESPQKKLKVDYDQRARDVQTKATGILMDNEILTQLDYTPWKNWTGSFDEWKQHVVDASYGWIGKEDLSSL